jgi:phosphoenolpyruvate-protein kinase (PTS system EI component)
VNLAERFTPLHPAVLRLIHGVVGAADAGGVQLGVCGEMASEPLTAFALLGLGVRQLSVAPRSVPAMKRLVRGVSVEIAREAMTAAMAAESAERAEAELRRRLLAAFGDAAFLRDGLLAT